MDKSKVKIGRKYLELIRFCESETFDHKRAKSLLKLVDINAYCGEYGYTLLYYAAEYDNFEMVKLLVESGVDVNKPTWYCDEKYNDEGNVLWELQYKWEDRNSENDQEARERLNEKNNPRLKILRYLLTHGAKVDTLSDDYLIPYVNFAVWNDFDQPDQWVHRECFLKTIITLCWDLPEYFTEYKPVDLEKIHLYKDIHDKDENGNYIIEIVDEEYETVRIFHYKLYQFRQYKRMVGQVLSEKNNEMDALQLVELYSDEIMKYYDEGLNVYQAADKIILKLEKIIDHF